MIAIKNGKVVTVTDKTFEHGTVLIEDGKFWLSVKISRFLPMHR